MLYFESLRNGRVLHNVLLPRYCPRMLRDQKVINAALKWFELRNAREIHAKLAHRIAAAEEMLATVRHNLERVQILDRQVTADRERMLALLNQLEAENRSLRRYQEDRHAEK